LALESPSAPTILCDTTFTKLDRTPDDEERIIQQYDAQIDEGQADASKLLLDNQLYNIGKVKSRGQGRVNTVRQILEMLILTTFRQNYGNDAYALVDGPLFFMGKWLRTHDVLGGLGDAEREEFVLRNAVGLVKSLRARPRNQLDLRHLLNMTDGQYSPLMKISDAVDIDADETFAKPHVTTFLRLRSPPEGLSTPNPVGLVRVDLHVSTLGAETFDEVVAAQRAITEAVEPVIRGVRRERWPGVTDRGRTFTQLCPIGETERMLHSRLYSGRELGFVYSMMRT